MVKLIQNLEPSREMVPVKAKKELAKQILVEPEISEKPELEGEVMDNQIKSLNTMTEAQQRAFWGWWESKDTTFTKQDIDLLLERVKGFNAGAIDEYLSQHVDKVYSEWLKERES